MASAQPILQSGGDQRTFFVDMGWRLGQLVPARMTQPPDHAPTEGTEPAFSRAVRRGWALGRKTIVVALVLSCIVLISLYLRVPDYGFYEDDYWAIVPFFKAPVSELWDNTVSQFETWTQGRPLNHSFPMWFSRAGYGLGGVQGIYFLGFLVQSLNAFLFYLLLRKWLDHWSAILGGCLLILLPADTTHIFIEHSAQLHTSVTCLLLALLIRRTRFWLLSYPIATLSLLSYETPFLPFIVFPLFLVERKKRIFQWLIHLGICSGVLLSVFGIRLLLSDSRANSAVSQPGDTLWRMFSSLWIGPETSLKTLLRAVIQAPHSQPPFAFLFAGLGIILLLLVPLLVRDADKDTPASIRSHSVTIFFAGLASWIFSYVLTLINYPPAQMAGRLTSVHLAAVFGLACAIAAATAYLRSFRDFRLKAAATGVASLMVAIFILYGFHIQSGFAAAWEMERRFWQRVIQLCPDITPNTRVILVGTEPRQNEFILSNSWADLLVLGNIFAWDSSPLFFYYNGLRATADFRFEKGQVTWKPFFWRDERETLNLGDVILLQDDGDDMTRISEFQIPEVPFPLHSKKLPPSQAHPSPSPLTVFGQFLLRP